MTARTLAQVDARLTAEILTRSDQLKGVTGSLLLDRIKALESQLTEAELIALKALAAGQTGGVVAGGGGTPLPPPAPPDIPPPTPPGYPTQVSGTPEGFTTNGETIENAYIDSFPGNPMDLAHQVGSDVMPGGLTDGFTYSIFGKGRSGCTLKNVTLRGRQWGALLVDMEDFQYIDVTVLDVNYDCIGVFGGSGELVRPIFKKVGMLRGTAGFAAGYPSIGDKGNGYAWKFERADKSGIAGASTTVPHDWTITDFLIEDVRTWQGGNAHEVNHLLIDGGKIYRTPRGIYVAGNVADVTVKNVEFIDPRTQAGGTSDLTAISFGNLQGGLFDANLIDVRYANRVTNIDFYSGGHSTGVTVGSNPVHTYP